MIDIFMEGPFLSRSDLLLGTAQEVGIYFLHYIITLSVLHCIRKIPMPRLMHGLSVSFCIVQALAVYRCELKSEFVFSLCLALLGAGQLFLLRLVDLSLTDYACFFSLMLFPGRLFNTTSALLGNLWLLWLPFCAVYTVMKFHCGSLRGNHFFSYFCFILLSLSVHAYDLACLFVPAALSGYGAYRGLCLACTAACTLVVLLLITDLIRRLFREQLLQLNRFGKKYPDIERYFPCLSLIVLCLFTAFTLPFSFLQLHNRLNMLLIPFLCILFLWAQLPFLSLLYRAAFYKDSATFHAWEAKSLASYYRDLSASLTAMQEIRHDMKNIFFTMGAYVDRSDDDEMKHFFWNNIYPYSLKTIRNNELLSRLYQIPVESLQAFLHLKLSQALLQKTAVQLEIQIVPEQFQTVIDPIDLTRILGILLDNAIEETRGIPDGTIFVKISGTACDYSYTIKNPITAQTKKDGICVGKSKKGAGRGNGLRIVHELLAQYHNAVLNTSVQQNLCIQCLNVSAAPANRQT